ncbi:helix-turn-helix transcriptional regulator [Acidithiobacillus ferridurans]|nr:helix-turn-helix transcriptional regulator [Acidithiobacillus ferridurans]
MLMRVNDLSQVDLAKKAGVSQRTISNILNPDVDPAYSPTLNNIEKIAISLKIKVWHLLLPNIPPELLTSRTIEKVVENYTQIDESGRNEINRVAEAEVRYHQVSIAGSSVATENKPAPPAARKRMR